MACRYQSSPRRGGINEETCERLIRAICRMRFRQASGVSASPRLRLGCHCNPYREFGQYTWPVSEKLIMADASLRRAQTGVQ